jgi:hypothetical protein
MERKRTGSHPRDSVKSMTRNMDELGYVMVKGHASLSAAATAGRMIAAVVGGSYSSRRFQSQVEKAHKAGEAL